MDNFLCQVVGDKEVTLWAPNDVDYLYADGTASRVLDIDSPDLETYPLYRFPYL